MRYWVAWRDTRGRWAMFKDSPSQDPRMKRTPVWGYDLNKGFSVARYAVWGIVDMLLDFPDTAHWCELGVMDSNGTIVWREDEDYRYIRQDWIDSGDKPESIADDIYHPPTGDGANQPQEAENMSDATITAPLNVKRTDLITRLKERQAEEVQKRTDAAARGAARRQALLDIVAKLSTDQVANILNQYVRSGDPEGLAKQVEEWVEDGKFVSKDAEPTSTETQLDRLVGVLQLASDTTVEVKPTDSIYSLL